ncbi:MAG: bifunctional demethylmenaquinone methyltransferase/2-methoxy-6-polyprenyl-1,4-benzoquinol methylase UbiE [Thermoplasmatota archaeon]
MSQEVEEMFAGIAPKYDRANAILSLGVDSGWRRKAVKAAAIGPGSRVLDVATGTGDLAFAFKKRVGAEGTVVGSDFCQPMLDVAVEKATRRGVELAFEQGDAMALPYPDDGFDAASIAFGIRNVDEPAKAVAEMARVVRPGGRVVVLEFGQPKGPISWPYRIYSKHVMPRIGALVTGDRAAYEYLPETAAAFPCGDAFAQIMRDAADFTDIQVRPLTGGIAWLYTGTVA